MIGLASELPAGTKKIVKLDGLEVAVFNVHGAYYALPNHCLHQGGPVCEGNIAGTLRADAQTGWKPAWFQDGEVIICPWHGLEFDITTGRCLARRRARLRQYPVRVENGAVVLEV